MTMWNPRPGSSQGDCPRAVAIVRKLLLPLLGFWGSG
jgi:hypothetical protein